MIETSRTLEECAVRFRLIQGIAGEAHRTGRHERDHEPAVADADADLLDELAIDGIQPNGALSMPADGKPEHELHYTPLGFELLKSHKSANGPNEVAPGPSGQDRGVAERAARRESDGIAVFGSVK